MDDVSNFGPKSQRQHRRVQKITQAYNYVQNLSKSILHEKTIRSIHCRLQISSLYAKKYPILLNFGCVWVCTYIYIDTCIHIFIPIYPIVLVTHLDDYCRYSNLSQKSYSSAYPHHMFHSTPVLAGYIAHSQVVTTV